MYIRDGGPIYYDGPHGFWNIAGGPQKFINFIFLYLPKGSKKKKIRVKERQRLLLTYCLHVCLSWSFVLTRCCVLTWVTKIVMREASAFSPL